MVPSPGVPSLSAKQRLEVPVASLVVVPVPGTTRFFKEFKGTTQIYNRF